MEIIIKKAKIADLPRIQELNSMLFQKEYKDYPDKFINLNWPFSEEGKQYFKNRILNDDGCVLVAVIGEEIVGYHCGGITKAETYRNLPKTAEAENIYVLKEYRSIGIGQKLFNGLFDWCKENNVKKIRLEASAQNKKAIKLYKKNGFWEYTLIMEKDL